MWKDLTRFDESQATEKVINFRKIIQEGKYKTHSIYLHSNNNENTK